MQQLYNQLINPIVEFNDKGEQVQKPPLSVMLRAARILKELDSVNTANGIVIQQYAQHINDLTEQLKVANESLHKAQQGTEMLGSAGSNPSGSDTTSEGRVQAEGPSPSPP